jgi:peptide deformylase
MKEIKEKLKYDLVEHKKIEGVSCNIVNTEECVEITNKYISDMKSILLRKTNNVGLAAPQIGINKRFVLFKENEEFILVFNPEYYPSTGKKIRSHEGCLSYPDKTNYVARWSRVNVKYFIYEGGELKQKIKSLNGIKSIVWQHEIDHLDGITIFYDGK